MKKTLITIFIVIECLWAYTFANDCFIVSWEKTESLIKEYEWITKYHKFLPIEWFKTVVYNLKAYCCSQNLIECSKDEKTNLPKKNFPESANIFDHLLDINMRRLDGISSLAYQKEVDPMAKIRREKINAIAADPKGKQAMTIEWLFTWYRNPHKKYIKNTTEVLKNYDTTNISILSMDDKYNKLCEITKLIYENIQIKGTLSIGTYNESNSFYKKCENMVRERVQRETQYTKLLMIQKSTQMFNTTFSTYTKTHFVEEKLMGLRNLITKVKDYFQTIVQQAPASKICK